MGDVVAGPALIDLGGDSWRFRSYLGDEWQSARLGEPARLGTGGWMPASVPGCVIADLVRAGEVPDPYYDRNSRAAEWASERWWAYQTEFSSPALAADGRAQLIFDGIDYAARIFLDGNLLGRHDGMFVPARFDVTTLLGSGRERHVLAALVEPAPESEPQTGDTARVRVHKTRMSYGWDFCPRLIQQGLWQPVHLRLTGPVRLAQVWVRTQPSDSRDTASVQVSVELDSSRSTRVAVRLDVRIDGLQVARAQADVEVAAGHTSVEVVTEIHEPRLWWPNGYGKQPLYTAEVTAEVDGTVSDFASIGFGVRELRLRPNAGAPAGARPYTFEVNGRPIFARGWNWVPIDMLYGVPRLDRLRYLLGLAHDAGVNVLRVWGGGLIETEEFYAECDRLGILVWQEFIQSSSGTRNAPAEDDEFVAMMAGQAQAVLPTRRNHPSLALWCGGNELMRDGVPLDEGAPVLSALAGVVAELDPGRPFLPTSPSGPIAMFVETTSDRPGHDVHGPWEHQGLRAQQRLYDGGAALLHSEFGVEGMSDLTTIEQTIPTTARWPPTRENPAYAHRGAWWINEPLVQAAFGRGISDLATMVRASQMLQADGLRYALEATLRRWPTAGGTLPWQFNEPFPNAWCTSAVDGFGRPKPAYQAVAGVYEPVHVSAKFERQAWAGAGEFACTLWVSNFGADDIAARVDARCLDANGRLLAASPIDVDCAVDECVELGRLCFALAELDTDLFVLDLRLADRSDRPLSQNRYLFSRTADLAPLRSLAPGEIEVEWAEIGADAWRLTLRNAGAVLVPAVRIEDGRSAGGPGWTVADTGLLTLLPGEARDVGVRFTDVAAADRRVRVSGWNIGERTLG